jgi:Protein of unknown function (DUF3767)
MTDPKNRIVKTDETTNISWNGNVTPTTTTSSNSNNNDNSFSRSISTEHAETTMTTFDIHPESTSSSNRTSISSATTDIDHDTSYDTTQNNTAQWTRYLPEAYGIRRLVEASKYRWCARESALWGIATGSAMALHRIRMNSPTSRVINMGFSTVFLVMSGSYYFCVKRRDYQEQMIGLLMQLNTFEPVQNMPAERPIDATHPFVTPDSIQSDDSNQNNPVDPSNTTTTTTSSTVPTKQYIAHIPERKEWQTPIPTQDASTIFQPYKEKKDDTK